MKLTINEIAELAKVAKSTVSKALNGKKGVSEEKRQLILRLTEQLDYQPNASAQALASNRSGFIGLVLPHQAGFTLSGAYWSTIISAVAQEATVHDYSLLLLSSGPDDDIGPHIESMLKRRKVDGLVLGSEHIDPKVVSTLILGEVPFVLIGRSPSIQHYSVDVDNEAASRRMVIHLASQGRERIACLAGPADYPYIQERVAGYRAGLRDAGLAWSAIEHAAYQSEDCIVSLARLLDRNPDALFVTAGGEFIFDAIDALRGRNLDSAAIGIGVFDDYPSFDYLGMPISRIRQPLGLIGSKAASLLFEIIGGAKPERQDWVLETENLLR